MSYRRVVPRDLFNESKLLKCLGQLSVNILDGKLLAYGTEDQLEDEDEGFKIDNNEDGDISCSNYHVFTKLGKKDRTELYLRSRLNSRLNYPLICETIHNEIIEVFDDKGKFSVEFIKYLKELLKYKG
jgi:hypothetical protein